MFSKLRVFLSYRRTSSANVARYIHDSLKLLGADVFMDVEANEILGVPWKSAIQEIIDSCDWFLIILSPNTLESDQVQFEVKTALEANKNIIPITTEGFDFNEDIPDTLEKLSSYGGLEYDAKIGPVIIERLRQRLNLPKMRARYGIVSAMAISLSIILLAIFGNLSEPILIGLLVIGTLSGIVPALFVANQIIGEALLILLPPSTDKGSKSSQSTEILLLFYQLFFWAILVAFLGGMVWAILNRINGEYPFMESSPYIGGAQSEPHGNAIFFWSVGTNALMLISLLILSWRYKFTNWEKQLLPYLAFLVGITIGGFVFYDLPISGSMGFRNYFSAIDIPFLAKEFLLVILWSSTLSGFGFLFADFVDILSIRKPYGLGMLGWTLLKQVGLCTFLTTLAVVCFLIFPPDPRFETARGIVAGLFLRVSLFFGLILKDSQVKYRDIVSKLGFIH